MPTEVRLPQMSMGMQEGTVLHWLKAVGDAVEEGEPLVEVEAEKSTMCVDAPSSGILARIVAEEGDEVPILELLAVITALGEALDEDVQPPTPHQPTEPVQVTPPARRLAAAHGIDLNRVTGSGPRGRITEQDVLALAPSAPDGAGIPLKGLRGTIAKRMTASLQTMAQLTLTSEVDVTDLVRRREELATELPVSITDLVALACVLALREHPRLNSFILDDVILEQSDVHLGIAVALPDGLVVPVVRNANLLDLEGIADERWAAVTKVREGGFSPEDVSGSTFTITNLGPHGIDAFTPIINAPEVAILGVGRITEHPRRGPGTIEWRQVMVLSLTFDHRALDGAPAAAFLQDIARYLTEPAVLLEGAGRA